jgi:hypothetical protein
MAKHSRTVACSTKKHEALAYVWNLNIWCSTTENGAGRLSLCRNFKPMVHYN